MMKSKKSRKKWLLSLMVVMGIFLAGVYAVACGGEKQAEKLRVPELYLTDNSIIVKTELKGPERSEPTGEEPSYPYIVLRTELLEEPVVFQ